ncbi:cofilin-2-like [Pristis pectinata]|uniref:cofilin-2-like n=1 Tax=Pristis pectinata TaxID=685728 RepID=UPI00223D6B2E|nr:cofilin-2-like [Pristis pectinata]
MSSGVKVCDSVIECFTNMKVRKMCSKEEGKKRKKAVLLVLNDSQELIVLDKKKEILSGDLMDGTITDALQVFAEMLPKNGCCYALFDLSYETKESKKEELVFIHWNPDAATVKDKMVYASSADALRKKIIGIKHEWQITSLEDLLDVNVWAEKLGQNVVSVECRKVELQCH